MAIQGIKGGTDRIRLEEHIPLKTPLRVLLDTSSICNFHCAFCPHGNGEAAKVMPQSIMPLSLAQKCIDDLVEFSDKIKMLSFICFGEPLINKDLTAIIRYAFNRDIAHTLEITTNASLLTHECADELIESGISTINISIYGLNSETYRQFSKASIDFEVLVQNIAYLYSVRQNAKIVVKISDAVCKSEIERAKFENIFSSICDKICVEHAVPFWYEVPMASEDQLTDIYGNSIQNKLVCPTPFFTMCINTSGIVTPCCSDWKNRLVMGNAYTQSLFSIWNGKKYRDLQKKLLCGGANTIIPCCYCKHYQYVALDNIDSYRDELLTRFGVENDL